VLRSVASLPSGRRCSKNGALPERVGSYRLSLLPFSFRWGSSLPCFVTDLGRVGGADGKERGLVPDFCFRFSTNSISILYSPCSALTRESSGNHSLLTSISLVSSNNCIILLIISWHLSLKSGTCLFSTAPAQLSMASSQ